MQTGSTAHGRIPGMVPKEKLLVAAIGLSVGPGNGSRGCHCIWSYPESLRVSSAEVMCPQNISCVTFGGKLI